MPEKKTIYIKLRDYWHLGSFKGELHANSPLTPLTTQTNDLASSKLGPAYPTLSNPFKCPVVIALISPSTPCTGTTPFLLFKIANRSITSKHVTQIDTTIRKIMIHVIRVIFLSLMLSDRISPKSKKT